MNQKHIDYLRGLYYENDGNIDAVCDAVGLDCDWRLQWIADELFRMWTTEALKELERNKYNMIEYIGKLLVWNFERDWEWNKIYDVINELPEEWYSAFIDIETTGLPIVRNWVAINDGRQPSIIEWACYTPWARHEWDVTLVNPQRNIPDEIQELTGISQDDVNKWIYLYDIDIDEYRWGRVGCFVFWNADFDANIINMNFKEIAIPANKAFCLMKYVTEHYPEIPRRHAGEDKYVRLIDAYNYFYPDKPVEQKHRARADVELMYAVYKAVKEKEEKSLTSSER